MAPMRTLNIANLQQFTAVNILSDGGAVGGPKLVPSCAVIRLSFGLEDGKFANLIIHGRYSGAFAGTQAQANAILAALSSGAQWTALAAFLPTTTLFGGVGIRDVNTADNPEIISTAAGVPGTSVSPSLPNEVSLVITKRTAKSGAQNRGRAFFAGWATNALGAGNVAAAGAVTALNNWAATIATAFAAQGYTLVLGQPARQQYVGVTGTVHPARVATSTPITQMVVRDNHWDSQRKRGLK